MTFVLKSAYPDGRAMYFRFWTPIGPCATPNIEDAERFATAHDAITSPAFGHWSSTYQPFEIDGGDNA